MDTENVMKKEYSTTRVLFSPKEEKEDIDKDKKD